MYSPPSNDSPRRDPGRIDLTVLAKTPILNIYARAELPTRHGNFEIVSFVDPDGQRLDDVAVVCGDVAGKESVPVRVHSECLTGDVFSSLRCDCRRQLELAVDRFAKSGFGLVLYLRQEGRGIGIAEKVRAYSLQQEGLDTVEANEHLGFDADLRDYSHAAGMLRALEVASVQLHTNNPAKISGLTEYGIVVERRDAIETEPVAENARYLATKRQKMGHLY